MGKSRRWRKVKVNKKKKEKEGLKKGEACTYKIWNQAITEKRNQSRTDQWSSIIGITDQIELEIEKPINQKQQDINWSIWKGLKSRR